MIIKEILLTVFYLALFNFLIYRFKRFQFQNFKPFVSIILFNVKFITGIFIWFIYTFYYKDVQNNDVHKFYNDALVLREVANESPKDFIQIISGAGSHSGRFEKYYAGMKNWRRNFDEAPFNENQTIIKINALLLFFSLKTYFVHILFFCFISLTGWVLLTNAVMRFTDSVNSILVIPVMLLPSVLFWTSGVMKEPLLVLGLGLFISGVLNSAFPACPAGGRIPCPSGRRAHSLPVRQAGAFICILMGFIIILLTKFFVLVCLIPAIIAFLIFRKNEGTKFILLKYATVNIGLLAIAFNTGSVIPGINLQQMLVNKQSNSIREAAYFNAGSRIDIPAIGPNAESIVTAAPVGIWNTMMRPYLWEGKNIMMFASALENVLIISLLILCIAMSDLKNFRQLNLVLFLINFSLTYFALIGICTPVLGNLVRYKAPLLPLIIFAFLLNLKPKVIPAKLQFLLR